MIGRQRSVIDGGLGMGELRHAESFRDLVVYQKAREVAGRIFGITRNFPKEETVTRIGGKASKFLQVQIISSTNRNLNQACREGRFRLDLLYRLNSVHIHLPPLRDRPGDIPVLAEHFIREARLHHDIDVKGVSSEALDLLRRTDYPGNIREFEHLIERAAVAAGSGWVLPRHIDGTTTAEPSVSGNLCSLKECANAHVAHVLSHCEGDRTAASKILGISVRQLQRRLAQMNR